MFKGQNFIGSCKGDQRDELVITDIIGKVINE